MKLKGYKALEACLKLAEVTTVCDYGVGMGSHSESFLRANKTVVGVDIYEHPNLPAGVQFLTPDQFNVPVDLIWCCHVLEHIPNPIGLLSSFLPKSKYTCITVPPLKHNIVSGHINLYNMGLLIYQMILAGYDMSQCSGIKYEYNISILVENKAIENFPKLNHDFGDIELLSKYFPKGFDYQGFNGNIEELNWL